MSLFENNGDPVTFETLVGEGKKYKDNDAVAKALTEKDRFIEQLKAEKQEVLRDLQARPVTDRSQEILDRLEELANPATLTPVTTPTERVVETKGLTEDDIVRVLQQRDAKARAEANVATVKTELKEKFGDQVNAALKSLQTKLGVDQTFLDNLAAQSPSAFSQLLGQTTPQTVFTPPGSTKPEAFKPTAGGPKPRSEYLRLKAENPTVYNSSSVQNQMYKDSISLGEAFFDVNE